MLRTKNGRIKELNIENNFSFQQQTIIKRLKNLMKLKMRKEKLQALEFISKLPKKKLNKKEVNKNLPRNCLGEFRHKRERNYLY